MADAVDRYLQHLTSLHEVQAQWESIGDVPAKGYSIEVSNTLDMHWNGMRKDLGELLPVGYHFHPTNLFQVKYETQQVNYDVRRIETRSFLVSLLHEMGHAHNDKAIYERAGYSFEKIVAWEKLLWSPSLSASTEAIEEMFAIKRQTRAAIERQAWAYALRQLRSLGYDSHADWTTKEMQDYISLCLWSYELETRYFGQGAPFVKSPPTGIKL